MKVVLLLLCLGLTAEAQVSRTAAFRGAAARGAFRLIGISTNAAATTRTFHNTNSVPAGALLVLTCANDDDSGGDANSTMSDNQSLSWTKVADASAANSGNAEIFWAISASGGTVNVTNVFGAAEPQSSVLYYFSGQETTPGGTNKTQTAAGEPSVIVLSTRAASYLVMVSSDFNGNNGVHTYRDSAVEALRHDASPNYVGYHYYKLTTTVTDYTEGLTAPAGQASGTALYEIRPP